MALNLLKPIDILRMKNHGSPFRYVRLFLISACAPIDYKENLLRSAQYETIPPKNEIALYSSRYLILSIGLDDVKLAQLTTKMIKYYKNRSATLESLNIDPEDPVNLILYWRLNYNNFLNQSLPSTKVYDKFIRDIQHKKSQIESNLETKIDRENRKSAVHFKEY